MLNSTIRPLAVPSQPAPPKPVKDARVKLEKLIEQLSLLDEQVSQAEQAVTEARTADVRHVANEAHKGRAVDDPHQREHAANREVERVNAPREGITLAIQEQTAKLIDAIQASHDQWRTEIDSELTSAHAELITAVDKAQAAARRLASARGADRWLNQFSSDYLEHATQRDRRDWPTNYAGADRLDLDVSLSPNQKRNVPELLAAVRSIDAKPAPPPQPRSFEIGIARHGDGSYRIGDPKVRSF